MSTRPKSTHGGIRAGAGAKPIYEQPMSKISVSLDARTIEKARRIGGGELSKGLREAVRRAR